MAVDQIPTYEFVADKLKMRFETRVRCNVDNISPSIQHIMTIVREMECARGKEFEVETALREALANAIIHGCKSDPSKEVQICVTCDETRGMLIVVRNPGEGFDPASIPSPTIGQNVYSSHGRGIFLINQLMDEVHFENRGTEIHMLKR